ncbi:MAG: WYL domain-containing protein [Leptospira sp.]|nr:WYL domain-containing protein [Leptospira sp.]
MNPSTLRAASKLNLIRILSSHPEGLSLEELQKITGHKTITELKKELGELYMIEMYPYSPQDCVDIDYDGEKVKIILPIDVDKILPLNPDEWILLRQMVLSNLNSDETKNKSIIESIVKKIDSIIPSGNWETNQKVKTFLKEAILHKTSVTISYWKRDKKEKEDRIVQPWLLWEENDSYLLAYDLQKESFRSFRLDCILSCINAENKFVDLPKNAKDWLEGFTQLISAEPKSNDELAKLYLTDASSYHLSQKLPLKDLSESKVIDGTTYYLYEAPIREEVWFINTILGYGKSIIVTSPIHMKEKILQQLSDTLSTL